MLGVCLSFFLLLITSIRILLENIISIHIILILWVLLFTPQIVDQKSILNPILQSDCIWTRITVKTDACDAAPKGAHPCSHLRRIGFQCHCRHVTSADGTFYRNNKNFLFTNSEDEFPLGIVRHLN